MNKINPHKTARYQKAGLLLKKAQELCAAQKFNEGKLLLEEVCRLTPAEAFPFNLLGACHFQMKDYTVAIESLKMAVALDKNYAAAWNNLALVYHHSGDMQKAVASFEKARVLDPKNLEVWNGLANLFYQERQLEKAEEVYKKAPAGIS